MFIVGLSPMFSKYFTITTLTPQTAIFGVLDSICNDSCLKNNKVFINHVLLIFKLYVYESRELKFVNINNLITEIQIVKRIEKETALNKSKKTIAFTKNST